jgi:hypothetical protein
MRRVLKSSVPRCAGQQGVLTAAGRQAHGLRLYATAAAADTTAVSGRKWDAIVVGGGHNGLVTAAYLAKVTSLPPPPSAGAAKIESNHVRVVRAQAGKKVAVLERRHLVGGAAVTEELLPGYKFSRASYLCSLFRPQIFKDLKLKEAHLSPLLSLPAHARHSSPRRSAPRHSPRSRV